ncbi:MAG: type II toxin-antitoxin system HicB family antitoxin [Fimbriimonas sp.]
MNYAVVYERAKKNWAAYVPDLPGCTSAGWTLDECQRNVIEAVEIHLEAMRQAGEPIPQPETEVGRVEVKAA